MNPRFRKKLAFVYEALLPALAILSLVFLVALGDSYFHPERQPMPFYIADHLMWAVFTADFCIRLSFAPRFKQFVASHFMDFVAIIPIAPFIFVLYMIHAAGFTATAKALGQMIFLIKFVAYLGRCYSMQSRFFKTNMLHYAAGITVVSLVISALLFSICENVSYGDALWFSIVTMTTTGYGEIVPHTDNGRMVAVFMMIAGVSCITAFTSILASRIMSIHGRSSAKNPHIEAVERQLKRFALLSEDEVEEMCIVLRELKAHQKIPVIQSAADIVRASAEEDNVKWHSLPFVKWVRRICRNFIGDCTEIDKNLSEQKDKKEN